MAGLVSVAACETDLVDDPGFQLWCGEQLCAWDLEEGEIQKVPTWHTHDYGVDLVGAPVLLSQVARRSASCVRIEVTSRVEAGAMVAIEVDADGDGDVDLSVPVGSSERFISRASDFALDLSLNGVFYLRKLGEEGAVVARLRVSTECGS
jgi:hypothetical protein